jgi:hypothetical protein
MRFFDLLGIQHFVLYLLPALAFIAIFTASLGFSYFRRKNSKQRETKIIERYPGGIEGRNAPFPLALTLMIAGAIIWGLLYIIVIGTMGVRI